MASYYYSNHPAHSMPVLQDLRPQNCKLEVKQDPVEALVATEGKEKTRKPIDPPPIVELKVSSTNDHSQQWLQSPYLFMVASLHKADTDAPPENAAHSLIGTLTSSLHRLKGNDNRDGGFFIFGDVSVMVQGRFRLHFSLYEMQNNNSVAVFLGTVDSQPFEVLPAKDFKGMAESTVLSRSFSDQGVRLRLRKEPRGLSGNKRKFQAYDDSNETPQHPNMASEHSSSLDEVSSSPSKRYKAESEDRRDSFPAGSHTNITTAYTPSYPTMPSYTIPTFTQPRHASQTTLPNPGTMSNYTYPIGGAHSAYPALQSGGQQQYNPRTTMLNTPGMYNNQVYPTTHSTLSSSLPLPGSYSAGYSTTFNPRLQNNSISYPTYPDDDYAGDSQFPPSQ